MADDGHCAVCLDLPRAQVAPRGTLRSAATRADQRAASTPPTLNRKPGCHAPRGPSGSSRRDGNPAPLASAVAKNALDFSARSPWIVVPNAGPSSVLLFTISREKIIEVDMVDGLAADGHGN